MLWPYLKIWEWEWIFGHSVKAISSLGVRSPCIQTCSECSFTSCTSSGLKAKGHKCSKSADEKMIFVPHVEPKTTNGKVSLDSWANLHDFSEKTNIKQKTNNDNDESYEAKQEFDNFDEQCSLDEEPKTKSGQKVARKQLSDSQLNFHDFSEETYNSNNDQGKNIKTSLSDIGDYYQKFKCARCDVRFKEKARLKRHEEISRSVKNIQTCNECKFISCTSMGLKSLNHKCSKTKIGENIRKKPRNYSQFKM